MSTASANSHNGSSAEYGQAIARVADAEVRLVHEIFMARERAVEG